MRKLVGIYEVKGSLLVSTYHRTGAGYWILAPGLVTSVAKGRLAELENAVLASLDHSLSGLPDPPRGANLAASLLRAAGVPSWRSFAKIAKSVAVELVDGRIEVTPDRNLGAKEGFVPMLDSATSLTPGEPGLGQAIMSALEAAG